MAEVLRAWEQFGAFCGLLLAGWWVGAFPHDDDGWTYPYIRLADRQETVHGLARRIDPGIDIALKLHDAGPDAVVAADVR